MAFAPVQSVHPALAALAALDPATSSSTAATGALPTNGRRSARGRLLSEGIAPGRSSRKSYDDEEDYDVLGGGHDGEGNNQVRKRALHPPSTDRGLRGAPLHRNGDTTTVTAASTPSLSPLQIPTTAASFRGLHGVGGLSGPAAGLPPGARGRHLTLAKSSSGLENSCKADSSAKSKSLLPDDPEVSTLLHLDQTAGAFLAVKGAHNYATPEFVYSEAARVEKWTLLRQLHDIIYRSPAPVKALHASSSSSSAGGSAGSASASASGTSATSGSTEVAVAMPNKKSRNKGTAATYRGVSVEGCLWRKAGTDGRVAPDVFVGALIAGFKFDRKLRMEEKLHRLYKCFEGAEAGQVDYREVAACLRILENGKQLPKHSRNMIVSLFNLWASEYYESDDSDDEHFDPDKRKEPAMILTEHALKVIGLGAESLNDLSVTRGRFMACVHESAPEWGLKPTTKHIPRALFLEILDRWPRLVSDWRGVMWNRMSDDTRLKYLQESEDLSDARYAYLDQRVKNRKAMDLFQGSLAKKHFKKWLAFWRFYHEQNNRRLYLLYRRTRRLVQHWHHWAEINYRRKVVQHVSLVQAQLKLLDKCYDRWKRWVKNNHKIAWCTAKYSPVFKKVAEGVACLRNAWRSGALRMAMFDWRSEVTFQANWEYAIKYERLLTLRLNLGAWRKHAAERAAVYKREQDAREQQARLKAMMEEFEKMDADAAAAEAAEAANAAQAKIDASRKEKEMKAYWKKQRKVADRQADDKVIRDMQIESIRARSEKQRRKVLQNFLVKWKVQEEERATEARAACRKWIANTGVSRIIVEQRLHELRKDFYASPGIDPESVFLESMRTSLCNVFVIWLMATLFKKKILLRDFVNSFDANGDGHLEGREFMQMMNAVEGLSLKPDQMHAVEKSLDSDGDGFISWEEVRDVCILVEKHNGAKGSPWKLYSDPVEHFLCYHNIQTGERIFDHAMTSAKLKAINEDNLVAEAEYKSRQETHHVRDQDWLLTLKNFAARIIQRMRSGWKQRRMLDELRYKMRHTLARKDMNDQDKASGVIAAAYLGRNFRREFAPVVRASFRKDTHKKGPLKGKVYYQQVHTREVFHYRPHLHRRYFPKEDW